MKKKKILEKNIEELALDAKIMNVLKENAIITVEDLWTKKRKDLKALSLSDSEITGIAIKLQLYGLDLNKKVY
jgi:DNA-directed RNA polymerase alpha subunit